MSDDKRTEEVIETSSDSDESPAESSTVDESDPLRVEAASDEPQTYEPAASVSDEPVAFSAAAGPATGRIDTEAMPLTEAFDVGSDHTGAWPATPAETMTPDPMTGAVAIAAEEPAKPVRVRGEREPAFLKRWVLALILLGVWIPAAAVGLLLYQNWFAAPIPHDRTIAVLYVVIWIFACLVAALLVAMTEPRPLVVALAFAILTCPAISVASGGSKYAYVACTAPEIPGVASMCPEPLRSWGLQYRNR